MNIGTACALFDDLNNENYSDLEKATAIHMVAEMPTHNSINKDKMLKAIKWLLEQNYEVIDRD